MKATRITLRTSGDPLAEAIAYGPNLVEPSDGYSSFDCRLVCYQDADGRPTLTPTAEVHVAYTFWGSARRGRYKLVKAAAPVTVELNLSFWGEPA